MSEGEEFELDYTIPPELRGFERLYPLLQGLTSGRSEQSFYERLQIILLLARWQREPPSIRDIGRQLDIPLGGLSSHLHRLRTAHWLTDHEQYYQLTVHARILAFVLQLVSQPWQEHDSVAVVTQLYAAASSQELGLGPALLFQDVVSTIEESIRRLGQALVAEQTLLVSQYHQESGRNVRMAEMALELRERGAVDHDFTAVARMHRAVSSLSVLSGQLEQHYLSLLERDLLTSGQVTLGDIQAWIGQAGDALCASLITPLLHITIPQPWFLPEGRLIAAEVEVAGKQGKTVHEKVPRAQRFQTLPQDATSDQHHRLLSELQGRLRQLLHAYPSNISLAQWVNQERWPDALVHMVSVLDPVLQAGEDPIFLHIEPSGRLVALEKGAVKLISDGSLSSAKEIHHAE